MTHPPHRKLHGCYIFEGKTYGVFIVRGAWDIYSHVVVEHIR